MIPGPMEHLLAFAAVLVIGLLIGVVVSWLASARMRGA